MISILMYIILTYNRGYKPVVFCSTDGRYRVFFPNALHENIKYNIHIIDEFLLHCVSSLRRPLPRVLVLIISNTRFFLFIEFTYILSFI